MIQRIQTIFLLAAAGAFIALYALPLATSEAPSEIGVFMDSEYNVFDNTVLAVLTGLGALISILTIFDFRNRRRQVRASYLGILVSAVTMILAYVLFSNEEVAEGTSIAAGAFMLVAAIVLFVLAVVYIRKDDKLVKSMDRLR